VELVVSYKHVEGTPAIEEKVRQKALKLKKFFDGKLQVSWICCVEKDVHSSEVTVKGDHFSYHATSSHESLYKTFDDVLHKLEKQLVRKKEMTKDKIHRH